MGFGSSVNPITTRGRIMPITLLLVHPDLKTQLHLCFDNTHLWDGRSLMPFEKTNVSPSSIPVEGKGWKSKAEPNLGKLTRGKIMVLFNFMPS